MKEYEENKSGAMNKDYQPSKKEFAGEMMGKTTSYIERTEKRMVKDASRVRSQAYKGRYD